MQFKVQPCKGDKTTAPLFVIEFEAAAEFDEVVEMDSDSVFFPVILRSAANPDQPDCEEKAKALSNPTRTKADVITLMRFDRFAEFMNKRLRIKPLETDIKQ